MVALAAVGWLGLAVARAHSGDSAFSRRIGAGCEELEPCLGVEAEAERRLETCSLLCGREAAELAAARQMRFRAEERRRVRDHYRERERSEEAERQRERQERLDEWQRERAARREEAARAREQQLELERLRREHLERRLADERRRRVGYLAALGPEGRALRLKRCLTSRERCDALTLDLLDAARDDHERRVLAEANERLVRPAPKPKASSLSPGEAGAEETSHAAPSAALPTPAGLDDASGPPSS
jgi:hypothetical protein